ncbi:MAG: hypothetical protein WCX77_02995, partial [Candidatus Paceibacterota bacterium]
MSIKLKKLEFVAKLIPAGISAAIIPDSKKNFTIHLPPSTIWQNKLPRSKLAGYSLPAYRQAGAIATGKVCLILRSLRAGIYPRPKGAGYSTRLNK